MNSDILLYTMDHCPHCRRAKNLLRTKGVTEWTEFDLETVPEKRPEMRARAQGRNTVPQVFIGDTHVGGASDLFALEAAGELDPLLASVGVGSGKPKDSARKDGTRKDDTRMKESTEHA